MLMATDDDTADIRPFSQTTPADDAGEPAALTLDREGAICDCNRSAEALFGFRSHELVAHHISLLLPQMTEIEWLQEGRPNPQFNFLCRIGRQFEAIARDGRHFNSRLFLIDLDNDPEPRLRLIIRRGENTESTTPQRHAVHSG